MISETWYDIPNTVDKVKGFQNAFFFKLFNKNLILIFNPETFFKRMLDLVTGYLSASYMLASSLCSKRERSVLIYSHLR